VTKAIRSPVLMARGSGSEKMRSFPNIGVLMRTAVEVLTFAAKRECASSNCEELQNDCLV
jgi:hypothetical protein